MAEKKSDEKQNSEGFRRFVQQGLFLLLITAGGLYWAYLNGFIRW